jgi:hypothetical protein
MHEPSARAPSGWALGLLVAANLVPLLGVIFLEWSLYGVMLAYWVESGIVGVLNVPRILMAQGAEMPGGLAARAGLAGFFCMHYGIFWSVHGVFVQQLFADGSGGAEIWLVAAALLLSHLVSLLTNYIGRGEYRVATPQGQMASPYGRVVALHMSILIGAFLIQTFDQALPALVLLIVFKTIVDAQWHLHRHRKALAGLPSASG